MPCRCSGINFNQCKCRVLGYPTKNYDSKAVSIADSESFCCFQENKMKRNILARIAEHVYEKCASYNLRYCHFRGFVKPDNCLSKALKDVFVLICFLIANFVVFTAIVIQITCHIYFFAEEASQRVKRYLLAKIKDTEVMVPNTIQHNYSPPRSYRIF